MLFFRGHSSSWRRYLVPSFFMLILIFLLVIQSLPKADSSGFFNSNNKCPSGKECVTLGIIYPRSQFFQRQYQKAIKEGFESLRKQNFSFMTHVYINNISQSMEPNPPPTAILEVLCDDFLSRNTSAIVFLTNSQSYGRSTASWQYFLQLAGYLGIPIIAWNADNSGLEQAAQNALSIQLAPSVHHQAAAMLSILIRYEWKSFSIVTSQIAGHMDFVQAIRGQVAKHGDNPQGNRFVIIDTIVARNVPESLAYLAASESRVILLYSTYDEAKVIFSEARNLDLTGENYIWIVAQSVIANHFEESLPVSEEFPVGMLGVHFDSSRETLYSNIGTAISVFANGVELFLNDSNRYLTSDLNPNLSCYEQKNAEWKQGVNFYRKLKNVTLSQPTHDLSFNENGKKNNVELKILNLRDGSSNSKLWTEIGVWRSWEANNGLSVNDIVWPGNEHKPPQGVPEKFHIKITFLDEPPYVNLAPADPVTNQCSANRGLPCRIPPSGNSSIDREGHLINGSYANMCCSGFCIDLLKIFADDLKFSYDLVKVKDGKWGTLGPNNKWNGLIGELQRRDGEGAEMILTSFKINKERETAVDFTVPFLESGIAIVVAKRTGIISPTAFLEPFDTASWMLVAFVAIQVAAFTIFIFEWLSPAGYNMRSGRVVIQEYDQMAPPRDHKFSLSRTYWLVWAVLFQAAVHVDCPRGFTARFMANMWAMFAVVFLAIYTANLAAFMITREEFHDFSGINDSRLQYPSTMNPPFKFGTVNETNSASVLQKHHQRMWSYMKRKGFLRKSVQEGIRSIKENELDVFIYDATVLDYLVGQDDDCQILTVGSWYAMSGYGLAFPRGSKYLPQFNRKLMEYKESGEIERLQRFWLTGTCKPKKQQRVASEPLAIEQFLSAYLLLACGIGLAVLLLALEHIYFKYFRKRLAKTDSGGCCALVSLSMGKSLTFRGAVYEATDKLRRHRCRDPICDTHLWRVKQELYSAKLRLQELENEIDLRDNQRGSYARTKSSSSLGDVPIVDTSQGSHPPLRRHDLTRNHVSFARSPALQTYSHNPVSAVLKVSGRLEDFRSPLERRHSYENRSPDSPLEGLLRCM